jgi:Tfp pilus assembly protein PilF
MWSQSTRAASPISARLRRSVSTQIAFALNPVFAFAFNDRGIAFVAKGDLDRGIADLDQAIKINANFATAFHNRGNAFGEKGDLDRAIRDYDQAIKINPRGAQIYYDRGVSYYSQRKYDLAIADFDQVVRIDPKDALAFYNRGIAYGKNEFDRAIADLNKSIEIDPKIALAHNRGNSYARKRDFDRAIRISVRRSSSMRNMRLRITTAASPSAPRVRLTVPFRTSIGELGGGSRPPPPIAASLSPQGPDDRAIADDQAVKLNRATPSRSTIAPTPITTRPTSVAHRRP